MNRSRVIALIFVAAAVAVSMRFLARRDTSAVTTTGNHMPDATSSTNGSVAAPVTAVSTGSASTVTAKTEEPMRPEYRDQAREPMQVAFTEDQQKQLREFEVKLNQLSGRAGVLRQKIAAAKYAAVNSDPVLKEKAAQIAQQEKELRTAMQADASMIAVRKQQDTSRAVFSEVEGHLHSLQSATGGTAAAEQDWKSCAICRSQMAEWPEHGPRTHEALAGMAAELARRALLDASREVVRAERLLRTNNVVFSQKVAAVAALHADMESSLKALPAVENLAQEEAKLLSEHAEIRAQCVNLYKSARREPIRLANPLEAPAGGSGT